jgi:branched-chain amino acid transport system permease protein
VERVLLGALQGVLSGILLGGVYGLIAIGLAMVVGVMRIVNFAHADFVMIAMYITFFVVTVGGLNPYLAVLVALPALFLIGLVLERGIIRFSYGQLEANQLVLTAAISLLLQNLALLLFSPTARSAVTVYDLVPLGPVFVNKAQVVGFGIALATTAGLTLLLRLTEVGRALRATVGDPEMASMLGVNVVRIRTFAFGLSAALAAVAGVVLATYYPMAPTVGVNFLVVAFVAMVMGGLTSISGAFMASLVVGVAQQVTATLGDARIQNLTVFVIFILLLVLRPQGLFSRRARA